MIGISKWKFVGILKHLVRDASAVCPHPLEDFVWNRGFGMYCEKNRRGAVAFSDFLLEWKEKKYSLYLKITQKMAFYNIAKNSTYLTIRIRSRCNLYFVEWMEKLDFLGDFQRVWKRRNINTDLGQRERRISRYTHSRHSSGSS